MESRSGRQATRLLNVRRLAALDMYGMYGTARRLWIITIEFVAGAIGCLAIGISILHAKPSPLYAALGIWLVGIGVNYVPLALHAVSLMGPHALDAELVGVNVQAELRTYGVKQFWIAVPVLIAVLATVQLLAARRQSSGQ